MTRASPTGPGTEAPGSPACSSHLSEEPVLLMAGSVSLLLSFFQ